MKIWNGGAWSGLILAAALLLAGCAGPTSVAERTASELPRSWTKGQQASLSPGEPAAYWLGRGGRFALITWGSSTCPDVVTEMEPVGINGLELHLEPAVEAGPCSADLAVMTHEFILPEAITDRPVTLIIKYADGNANTTLSLD